MDIDINFQLNDISFMKDIVAPSISQAENEISVEISKQRTDVEKDCSKNEGVKAVNFPHDTTGAVMQVLAENRVLMNYFLTTE